MRNFELLIFVAILSSFSIGLPPLNPWLAERAKNEDWVLVQALQEVVAGSHANPVTIPAESRLSVPDWSNSLGPQYLPPQHYSWGPPTSSAGQHSSNLVFHPTELAPPQAVPHWAHPTTAQAAAHVDQLPSAQASTSHVEPSSRTFTSIINPVTRTQRKIEIPRPLTQAERVNILTDVSRNIETHVHPNLIYPFNSNGISPALLDGFKLGRYLREIQSGFYVIQRRTEKEPNAEQIAELLAAGMEGTRLRKYQMYVWKHVLVPGEASLNIFHLVGLLEAGVVSHNAIKDLPKYLIRRGDAQALGSDSILVLDKLKRVDEKR